MKEKKTYRLQPALVAALVTLAIVVAIPLQQALAADMTNSSGVTITFPSDSDRYTVYTVATMPEDTNPPTAGTKLTGDVSGGTGEGFVVYLNLTDEIVAPWESFSDVLTVTADGETITATNSNNYDLWLLYSVEGIANNATVSIEVNESIIIDTPSVTVSSADAVWTFDNLSAYSQYWGYDELITPGYSYSVSFETSTYTTTEDNIPTLLGVTADGVTISDATLTPDGDWTTVSFAMDVPADYSGDTIEVTVETLDTSAFTDGWNYIDNCWYYYDGAEITDSGYASFTVTNSTGSTSAPTVYTSDFTEISGTTTITEESYTGYLELDPFLWELQSDYASAFSIALSNSEGVAITENAILETDGTFTIQGSSCPPGSVLTVSYIGTVSDILALPVVELSGTATGFEFYAGSETSDYVYLWLELEADYDESTPTATWDATGEDIPLILNDAGCYEGEYTPTDTTYFPSTMGTYYVTVSGVTANSTGDTSGGSTSSGTTSGGTSGGGSSSGEEETVEEDAIRVDNDLIDEDSASETTLWPGDTTVSGGTATTTVTSEEMDALIELADYHASDLDDVVGDPLIEGTIVVEEQSRADDYALSLSADQVQTLSDYGFDRFNVKTPLGSVSVYNNTLAELASTNSGLLVSIKPLDSGTGADITITAGDEDFTYTETPYGIRIVLPYTPSKGEDTNALIIEYIHEDGEVETVTESFYSEKDEGLVFFTNHLSKFGVSYNPAAFPDVPSSHWASPYVTYLASRNIVDGVTFRPDDAVTRGEALSMVTNALSAINLPQSAISVYSDVSATSSLASATSWVYFNNLIGDITRSGTFSPSTAITRQDMALMVGNISTGVGLRLRSQGLDTTYADGASIASYAQSNVEKLSAAGVLQMTSNYKFNPQTTLTRGEMAQIVATLLSTL